MQSWLTRWTVDQWRAIDDQYRKEPLPNWQAVAVLLTSALSLILARFYGRPSSFAELTQGSEIFVGVPYPDLHPHVYWAFFKLLNYGLLPLLCIKLVLKRPLLDHGLRLTHTRGVWLLYAGLFLLVIPFAYAASTSEAFLTTYPKYRNAHASWIQFGIWELCYALQFLMLEFFFRGFMIFGLARSIGSLAIFVMIVPYAMIHFGKPLPECLGSVLAGTALATLALRTGSIYGGVALHCGVAWSMDLFALAANGSLAKLWWR